MWGLVIEGAILVGGFLYSEWRSNQAPPKPNTSAKVPRVDDGAPIPLVYGRCRVRAPLCVWTSPTTTELGSLDPTQNVFTADLLFVLGIPFHGGTGTLNDGSATGRVWYGDIRQDLRGVFSSPVPEVYDCGPLPRDFLGTVEFWPGSSGQQISDGVDGAPYLSFIELRQQRAGISATLIPSYRNMMLAFMCSTHNVSSLISNDRGFSFSYDPVIPSISFEVIALSTGSTSDLGRSLANDADPAAVLVDLLTSPWGKLGLPIDKIDMPSFQAASVTLFAEQHGYSRVIDVEIDANEAIQDVLRQIDGNIYEEPTTGKLVLRLVRHDYDVNVVPNINPDNARPAGSSWYQVQAWSETYNQVRVAFTDRVIDPASGEPSYADGIAVAQDSANYISQGGRLRSTDVHFPGCCTRDLAQRLGSRELAAVSVPMSKVTVVVGRSFYQARPTDVFTFTWPQLGIDKMVMRVATVNLGQLHKGEITLELVRDIFDQTRGGFRVV